MLLAEFHELPVCCEQCGTHAAGEYEIEQIIRGVIKA